MAEAITLTDNERRQLDIYDPGRSANPPGSNLVAILERLGNVNILTGSATITAATSTTVVGLPEVYNGGFVLVSFTASPGAADLDVWGSVAGGTLTINLSASSTETINYLVIADNRT